MTATLRDAGLARHLPPEAILEVDPSQAFPPEIFQAALSVYLSGKRLDMKELGQTLGISRATLYRKTGNRDQLLGAVLLYLMQQVLDDAMQRTAELAPLPRVQEVSRRFMQFVAGQQPFQIFLEQEPEAALRILTSKQGPVQRYLVALAERELNRLERPLALDHHDMAYIVVRICESFMYADVIADAEPNVDFAAELIGRLLRSSLDEA